ncbi:unnamed protein product [Cylindrotheca closterium]|uniref:Methyltransferase small domain-containing protein n=1 Tax=Cylindrotheca closterium TaxID=2856 RepID=A0AAD2CIP5_9STRA|nr:unnamed protein product [Cylindrotheca closterium]
MQQNPGKFISFAILLLWLILWTPACQSSTVKLQQQQQQQQQQQYAKARQVRALFGHDAAQPLYEELLATNPADTTAATRVASNPNARMVHSLLGTAGTKQERLAFTNKLGQLQFRPVPISQEIFGGGESCSRAAKSASRSSAPLYLKPLRAGAVPPPLPESPLVACIQLLLLAVCLPTRHCVNLLGGETVALMETLGIVYREKFSDNTHDDWLVPYCHVMPVRVEEGTVYIATDLHPDVLSTTTVPNGDGTVMYIGPDSLALLDHCNLQNGWISSPENMRIVDIGCGSGIQALRLSASSQRNTENQVTSVDVNPRALAITRLNFEWNGLETPSLVLGDITQSAGGSIVIDDNEDKSTTWQSVFNGVTHILSNPPFLPVPVQDDQISKRYGLFSSGGASGEEVLRRIAELAAESCSNNSEVKLAIVSEFMNPDERFSSKLQEWWKNGGNPKAEAFFFCNQEPLTAEEYSQRRADSDEETDKWIRHLKGEDITTVSPGLLYMQSLFSNKSTEADLRVHHHCVPKTDQGSIWTPTNEKARQSTQEVMDSFI